MAIIEVKDLVKTYKTTKKRNGTIGYIQNLFHPQYQEFTAVDHINMNIEEGELVGYIGENRSRKIHHHKNANRITHPNLWANHSRWTGS